MKYVSVALFAGIVGLAHPVSAGEAAKTKESVLHSFGSGSDGQLPTSNLIDVKGTLYGVAERGGASGNGAVFAVDSKTGAEAVLYSFCSQQNCTDGQYPLGGLIDVHGTLYGTTELGGTYGAGTVFSLDPKTGAETVIYSFADGTDGAGPEASLIDVNGTLFGTTALGGAFIKGAQGYGTVFSVDPSTGQESVLYHFCGQTNCTDGGTPIGGLIDVNGTLYGTTSSGGVTYSGGTVFALNVKTRVETTVYSFCSQQNCADGQAPLAGLIDAKGTLYGTTSTGGATNFGTVFALDPTTGGETVLYSFCSRQNCADGANPYAGVIDEKGTLYGTTFTTGGVFALDLKSGKETVLHTFCSEQNCADGEDPYASLTDVRGTLFGTTQTGGAYGLGTVFALKK